MPESIRVTLTGELPHGVYAKDIALALAGELGADGANYQALEFAGEALEIDDRLVLCNLAVEMGAKNGVFACDARTREYLAGRASGPFDGVSADKDAHYAREITIALDRLDAARRAAASRGSGGTGLAMRRARRCRWCIWGPARAGAFAIITKRSPCCARAADRRRACKLVVTPASRAVLETLRRDGTLAEFARMGATIGMPGCGSCCGTCGPIPGDGVNVISTANRNFKGRMGNGLASIYLASPASCAAAAVRGAIADPREFAV